jgi:hypothetical protein
MESAAILRADRPRGALPPTIVLSAYQADSIAKILGTLGYLTAIGAHAPRNGRSNRSSAN